jgi:hypothetical protein
MLIKPFTDRSSDIDALTALLAQPAVSPDVRLRIQQEIRNIRAGAKGEAEAAYEIEFHHKASRNWAVIHDLRIDHQGRVAQIDHLVINRTLDIWVCESKHFSEGVAVNDAGEFTAWYGGRPYGVPSPIEQNRKHVALLDAVLRSGLVPLPTRLGLPLRPALRSVVLISKNARISRPKTKIDGLDQIVKVDQFRALLEKSIDTESTTSSLASIARLVSPETLEKLAHDIARLHRPIVFDWAAKFGLQTASPLLPAATAQVQNRGQSSGEPHAVVPLPDDPHEGRLSTSKLAAKHGVRSAGEMLNVLTAAGYLSVKGDTHCLTPRGVAAGAVLIEKSRYGPYFLWPADLQVRSDQASPKSNAR